MRKGYTTVEFPKELARILVIESRRLGFHSVSEYVDILNKVRLKMAWTKLDLEILAQYGRLPETTVMTEQELRNRGYKKVSEMPLVDKMPTSEQTFKGKT